MDVFHYIELKKLIGQKVINSLGNDYGKVYDLLISPGSRRVLAVIMAVDGFLNTSMGAEYVAIPWQGIELNPNSQTVSCSLDKATIAAAPHFDLDKLRKGKQAEFERLYSYYGYDMIWGAAAKEALPPKPYVRQGRDVGERSPSAEGSHQITKHYPGPEGSQTRREASFDKMKGLGESEEKSRKKQDEA
jgi:sporulation protein YlmC with PRC-barrel domain